MSNDSKSSQGGLPFPRHWLYLIALKIIALAVIVYSVLHWQGLL